MGLTPEILPEITDAKANYFLYGKHQREK